MNKKFSDEEFAQTVKDVVFNINKEDAMHCAPIHSVEEILARRKADDLHALAKILHKIFCQI